MKFENIGLKKFLIGISILLGILLIQIEKKSNSQRYHLVIQQPFEGETRRYDPQQYIYDSKTGDVYYEIDVDGTAVQFIWKPKKKFLIIDTLKIKDLTID